MSRRYKFLIPNCFKIDFKLLFQTIFSSLSRRSCLRCTSRICCPRLHFPRYLCRTSSLCRASSLCRTSSLCCTSRICSTICTWLLNCFTSYPPCRPSIPSLNKRLLFTYRSLIPLCTVYNLHNIHIENKINLNFRERIIIFFHF